MTSTTRNTTLTSLAMLKVNLDERDGDYLDYLVPFVVDILRALRPDPVTEDSIADQLRATFGLEIPTRGVQLVLRRLAKADYLKRESGVFRVVKELPEAGIDGKREAARRDIQQVCDRMVAYAKELHGLSWTVDDATRSMLRFIGEFSVECLKTYTRGTALPEIPATEPGDLYLASNFVKWSFDNDHALFDAFMVVVKGHMLANALICPDLESVQRKFQGVTFYFDTPLVLSLLNLQGSEEQVAAEGLLHLLQQLEARTAVFAHTAEEVHRVITGVMNHLDNPRALNRIIVEMRRQNRRKSDLALIVTKLNDHFGRLKLARLRTPQYDPAFQINEQALEKALDKDIGYFNERALTYDVNSIRSIYALRKGKSPYRIEDAVAVLVTSNSSLAKTAFRCGQDWGETREVSSVITDFSLANVAWLKAPLSVPNLPEQEVLAVCYAAMEPEHGLWSKYIDEIEKLEKRGDISPRDHELLRVSLKARDELMHLTLGSEAAFSGATVRQILDRVKAELVAQQTKLLAKERNAHEETKNVLEAQRQESQLVRQRVDNIASTLANGISMFVWGGGIVAIVIGGVFASIPLPPLVSRVWWVSGIIYALMLCALAWGILGAIFGWSLRDMTNGMRSWLKKKLYHTLATRVLGGVEAEESEKTS